MKPYVVSGDIRLLLEKWAEQKGFILPNGNFFSILRGKFCNFLGQIFDSLEFISEEELTAGIKKYVEELKLAPVSLDRVYYPAKYQLDITRTVNEKMENLGLSRRANSQTLASQFKTLKSAGLKKIVLVDDVIFTGDLIQRVARILSANGIKVSAVVAGIGIGEGVNLLRNCGYEVFCVREYEDVIDEICERDFYPGVPLSGRLLAGGQNIGLPYILPFGNPQKWASIPDDRASSFSKFCIKQTIALFEAIEISSGKEIRCRDIGRKIFLLTEDERRYVHVLREFS